MMVGPVGVNVTLTPTARCACARLVASSMPFHPHVVEITLSPTHTLSLDPWLRDSDSEPVALLLCRNPRRRWWPSARSTSEM